MQERKPALFALVPSIAPADRVVNFNFEPPGLDLGMDRMCDPHVVQAARVLLAGNRGCAQTV